MNKKTLFLIVLLILTVGLLLVTLQGQQQQKKVATQTSEVVTTPTPVSRNFTTLVASPSANIASVGEEKSLTVVINTGRNNVASVQLEILFNSEYINIGKIEPLGFFPNPTVLLNEVDNKNGTVSYAIGTPEVATGSGELVRINFTAKKSTAGASSPITFLPKTAVGEIGNPSSVLREAVGANIIIR